MQYAAIALAAQGFALGLMFRFKAFIPIAALILAASIIFAVISRMTFVHASLTVLCAQVILQGGYFLGAVARGFTSGKRSSHVL